MVDRNLRRRKGDDVKVEEPTQETTESALPKAKSKTNSKKSAAKVHFEDDAADNDSGSELSDPPPSPPTTLVLNLPSTPSKTKKGIAKPKVPPKPKVKAAPKSKASKAKVSDGPEPNLSAIPSAPLLEKDSNVAALLSHPPPEPNLSAIPPSSATLFEEDPNPSTIPPSAPLEKDPNVAAHLSHQPPSPIRTSPQRPLSPSEYPFGTIPSPPRQGTPEGSAPTPPYHLPLSPSPSPSPSQQATDHLPSTLTSASPPPLFPPPIDHSHEINDSPPFEIWSPEVSAQAEIQASASAQIGNVKEKGREGELWQPSENNPRCPSCVEKIKSGVSREDVRCFGGPPCVECKGRGWSSMECCVGSGEVGKGRKRVRTE